MLRKALSLILVLTLIAGLSLTAHADDEIWRENPTGYTQASDVVYVKDGTKVANWGVRGELATFLTSYAEDYYTDGYTFETLSANQGDATTGSTPQSALYKALQSMLKSKQTSTTSYADTRDLYKYTDCMVGNYSNISSFYSGRKLKGAWDSGSTWNREHTWPNSKISGSGENDIMMLRPTSVQENSDRGNKAYGESAGCYDPNVEATPNGFNVRGDCARIILYVYVRWGETADVLNNMWGVSGVMESLDILLKWMAEDPVDTWELGRNDAVQSITGVRNVFVDYPEFAWLLFDQSVPADYPTPSAGAAPVHEHACALAEEVAATCTEPGVKAHLYCAGCGKSFSLEIWEDQQELVEVSADDLVIAAPGHNYVAVVTAPTCTEAGYTTYTCSRCNDAYTGDETEASGHSFVDGVCTICGAADPDYDPTPDCPFADVDPNAFYYEPMLWAVEHGVTTGSSATTFSPAKNCTRGQVVTFLWRAFGEPAPTVTTHNFTDVDAGKFYYTAMLWAVENGVTSGTSKTTFSPDKDCTRGQVVTFLWRAKGKPAALNATDEDELPIVTLEGGTLFTDVEETAFYYEAMLWAVSAGVTTGTSATTFSPSKPCTRGQVVTFLYRAMQ